MGLEGAMKPGGTLALLRVGEVGVSEIEDRRLAICDAMIMCGGRGRGERWSCAERDLYTVCLAITEAGIRGRSCGLQLHSRGKRQPDPTTQSGKVLFSDNQIYLLVCHSFRDRTDRPTRGPNSNVNVKWDPDG